MKKQEKGITLIALIITIVLLLILAVVAIQAIQNDGIIEHAKNSVGMYQNAQNDEAENLRKYEYELEKLKNEDLGSYEEYLLEQDHGLKIGDYVEYTYDTVSGGYLLEKKYSGTDSDQTIKQTSGLKWRVLGLDKNGNIELISDKQAYASYVYFHGAAGYNNGVFLLNDMCNELYGNEELNIKGRSLNIEDIYNRYSDLGKSKANDWNPTTTLDVGEIGEWGTGNNYYPSIYGQEKGFGINGTIRTGGIGRSDAVYTSKEDLVLAYDENGNKVTNYTTAKDASGNDAELNITQTMYNLNNSSSGGAALYLDETFCETVFVQQDCLLASRFANNLIGKYGNWGYYRITAVLIDGDGMFKSTGAESGFDNHHIRPVVTLPSDLTVDTTTGNGSATSMYKIVKK